MNFQNTFFTSFGIIVLLVACMSASASPIFPNSVASNDIDFVKPNDPSVFTCLAFEGTDRMEMPSKLRGGLFLDNTHIFRANFSDGTSVPIWVDPAVGDLTEMEALAKDIALRVGQLPTLMRDPLDHIVLNAGDHSAQEEADGGFFMLYEDNIRFRMQNHDLSETIFHESAHVSLQNEWLPTNDWAAAKASDNGFITQYAKTDDAEDFAESALFAYTYIKYPDRLPNNVRVAIETTILNRVEFFRNIIVDWAPHVYQVGAEQSCS